MAKKAKKGAKKTVKKTAKKQVSKTAPKQKRQAVEPLGDRVLIKPTEAEAQYSPGGIIIPDTAAKEKPEQGVVVAVGEGKRTESGEVLPMRVSVGDTVMFSKYGYDEVKIDDKEYYIVSEANILAILNA